MDRLRAVVSAAGDGEVARRRKVALAATAVGGFLLSLVLLAAEGGGESGSAGIHAASFAWCLGVLACVLTCRPSGDAFFFTAIAGLLVVTAWRDLRAASSMSDRHLWGYILAVDLLLIGGARPRACLAFVAAIGGWLLVLDLERTFRVGIYDIYGSVAPSDRADLAIACTAPPCPVADVRNRAAYPIAATPIAFTTVLLVHALTARWRENDANTAGILTAVEDILAALADYELERAADLLDGVVGGGGRSGLGTLAHGGGYDDADGGTVSDIAGLPRSCVGVGGDPVCVIDVASPKSTITTSSMTASSGPSASTYPMSLASHGLHGACCAGAGGRCAHTPSSYGAPAAAAVVVPPVPEGIANYLLAIFHNLHRYRAFLPDEFCCPTSGGDAAALHAITVTEASDGSYLTSPRGGPGPPRLVPGTNGEAATIVFTDVRHSTELWNCSDHGAMLEALRTHDHIIRGAVARYDGYEVKTVGDSFMLSFCDATRGVDFGISVQTELAREALWPAGLHRPTDDGFEVFTIRIGMHTGAVAVERNVLTGRFDYFGATVNCASRVESLGASGAVTLTNETLALVDPAALDHCTVLPFAGGRHAKGFSQPLFLTALLPLVVSAARHDVARAHCLCQPALSRQNTKGTSTPKVDTPMSQGSAQHRMFPTRPAGEITISTCSGHERFGEAADRHAKLMVSEGETRSRRPTLFDARAWRDRDRDGALLAGGGRSARASIASRVSSMMYAQSVGGGSRRGTEGTVWGATTSPAPQPQLDPAQASGGLKATPSGGADPRRTSENSHTSVCTVSTGATLPARMSSTFRMHAEPPPSVPESRLLSVASSTLPVDQGDDDSIGGGGAGSRMGSPTPKPMNPARLAPGPTTVPRLATVGVVKYSFCGELDEGVTWGGLLARASQRLHIVAKVAQQTRGVLMSTMGNLVMVSWNATTSCVQHTSMAAQFIVEVHRAFAAARRRAARGHKRTSRNSGESVWQSPSATPMSPPTLPLESKTSGISVARSAASHSVPPASGSPGGTSMHTHASAPLFFAGFGTGLTVSGALAGGGGKSHAAVLGPGVDLAVMLCAAAAELDTCTLMASIGDGHEARLSANPALAPYLRPVDEWNFTPCEDDDAWERTAREVLNGGSGGRVVVFEVWVAGLSRAMAAARAERAGNVAPLPLEASEAWSYEYISAYVREDVDMLAAWRERGDHVAGSVGDMMVIGVHLPHALIQLAPPDPHACAFDEATIGGDTPSLIHAASVASHMRNDTASAAPSVRSPDVMDLF